MIMIMIISLRVGLLPPQQAAAPQVSLFQASSTRVTCKSALSDAVGCIDLCKLCEHTEPNYSSGPNLLRTVSLRNGTIKIHKNHNNYDFHNSDTLIR